LALVTDPGFGWGRPAGDVDDKFDSYLERLVKLVPGDAMGLYLVGSSVVPREAPWGILAWSAVCLAAVFVIRVVGTREKERGSRTQWATVIISCISFLIWLYVMGGPFQVLPGLSKYHIPWIGSLGVITWTFFVPYLRRLWVEEEVK